MVHTVSVDDVDHMVCIIECDQSKESTYFTVKSTTGLCQISSKQCMNILLKSIKITYKPTSSNTSTTGHKLQGSALEKLVSNS